MTQLSKRQARRKYQNKEILSDVETYFYETRLMYFEVKLCMSTARDRGRVSFLLDTLRVASTLPHGFAQKVRNSINAEGVG
jgi:hypothetical protein